MQKHVRKLSFLLSILLVFQLLLPIVSVFAASIAVPTNLQATVYNSNDVSLKWDADYYSKSFNVYKLNGDQKELVGKTTSRTLYLSKIEEGTYKFAVSALSSSGEETTLSSSIPVDIVYPEVPSPMGLSTIIYNENDVLLKWNSSANATNYKIYQVINGEKQLVSTTNNTSHYLSRLAEGDYQYEVTSYNSRFGESDTGSQINVSIVFPELQAPEGLTSNIYNGNDLFLDWQDAGHANKYNIYRIIDGQKELVTTTKESQQYLSQVPEGNYVYEVSTVSDRFGESDEGSQLNVSIVYPKIQAPKEITYKIQNGNDIFLDWQDQEYANKYKIYRVIDGQKELVTTTSESQQYFSQMPEGDYVYEVITVSNRFGESEQSSKITVPLIHPEIQAPGNLTQQIYYGNDLFLNWDNVDYANKYNVYRIVDGKRELVITVKDSQQYFSQLTEGDFVYEVTAVSDRFGESVVGSQLSISIVYPEIQPPKGLTSQFFNGNDVQLSWEKAENANKYNVYRIVDGQRELVATTADLQSYLSLLPEGDYVYEVTTVSNRFGESKKGSKVSFSIVYPEIETPELNLEMIDRDSALLTWGKVDYANTYSVYEVVNGEKVLMNKGTSTTYQTSDLSDGSHEFIVVANSNRFGESPDSNKVVAKVKPETPDLSAPIASEPEVVGDDVTLSWDPVEGADSYNVYEIIDGEKVLVGNTEDPSIKIEDLESGDHEFEIVPVDESGVEGSESTTVTVEKEDFDVTAPVTTANVTDEWQTEDFTVKFSATDDKSGVDKTFYSIDGAGSVEGTEVIITEEGVHTVYFYSIDKAGNTEKVQTAEVKIDKVAPETKTNVQESWLNEAFTLDLTATDDLSGVAKTYYSVNDGEFVEGTTLEVNDAGITKVSFYSVDNAGNVEEAKTIEVKNDVTAPETTSNVTDAWFNQAFTVELSATDDLSGVAKTFYSINDGEYVEGTSFELTEAGVHTVKFYSVDNAGNKEEAKTVEVKIDEVAPETTSNVEDAWLNQAFTVELTATDDLSGVAKTYYSINDGEYVEGTSFELAEAGVHTVKFYSVDNAGNEEEAKTFDVKIDEVAPETASNVEDTWLNQAFAVELTATDDLSGVAKTFYSINDGEYVEGTSFELAEAGVHTVKFYSVDNAGNEEEAKTVDVKIDEVAPETASNVEDTWLNQAFAVELTATDDLSGVAKTFYSINDGEYAEGTSFELTEAGVHTVKFYSVDNAGNEEEAKTVEVKIDEVAPETTSNVEDTWLNQAFTIELTATDDQSGVAKTFYSINDGEYVEGTSFELTEAGVHTVKFYSVDNAGNKEEAKTVEVKIDEVAPETTSNVEDAWLNQAFTIELTATDDQSGVAKTYYSINDGEYVEGTSFELTEAGVHTVKFYSVDNAGNEEEAKTVEVKIDEAAPVTASNVKDGWITQDFTVELTATDDLSGVAKTFYSINGGQYVEGTSFKVSEEGIHKVSYYSVDQAGNVEEAKTVEVKVDKSAPVVAWKIGGGSVDTGSNSSSCQCGFGLWYSPYTPGLNYVACVIQHVFFPWWYNGSSYGSAPTENIVELGDELELGTTLTINYDAADALSGIAAEELTVNGKKIAKGEKVTFDKTGENIIQLTVTDKAGLKTTLTKSFVVYIPGELEITPGIIKGNKGEFTARVSLPKGNRTNFDLGSVTLNGVKAVDKGRGSDQQASQGMFKFNRQDFDWNRGEVSVEFRGTVNGQLVIARTTVTVK